ncbi:MAG: metallophosphoesterase family protein, partial [Flavobacteriaceae bacterium]|nr:metallophosphoesterase family protein [Flavobacteriaceae bacterium]
MSTYVIGDIHGGYKALKQLIEKINPRPTDQLVFLGDFVDGWSQPVETIEYALRLSNHLNCVFIRGNHDDLAQQWMEKNTDNPMWLLSGGLSTVNAYNAVDSSVFNKHLKFFQDLKNYHIDAENRLFVHAGFHNLKGVEHEYSDIAFYWD